MRRLLPCLVLAVAAALALPSVAGAALAGGCTITVNPAQRVVHGTSHADVICVHGSGHVIFGMGGNDEIIATGGANTIYGGSGNDTITTGPGRDVIAGGDGNDHIQSGAGNDDDVGGPGNDTIQGGQGNDSISGDAGSDTLDGGAGSDQVNGDPGNDTVDGDPGNDDLTGGQGNDTLNGGPGNDTLDPGVGTNWCTGGGGNDDLYNWCDHTPPTLDSLTFSTTSIDTSQGPVSVTVTAHISDNLSGVDAGQISAGYGGFQIAASTRSSGTARDGVYQGTMTLPQYTQQGQIPITVTVNDQQGNELQLSSADLASRGFASEIDQTGAGDAQPPAMTSFSLENETVDTTTQAQTVYADVHVTDDLSGVSGVAVWLSKPDGTYQFSGSNSGPADMISGTPLDGVMRVPITIPEGTPTGDWQAQSVWLMDRAGHQMQYSGDQFEAIAGDWVVHQTGAPDTTPPTISSLTVGPTDVDETSDSIVWLDVQASDAGSGVHEIECRLLSADRQRELDIDDYTENAVIVSGDVHDGEFRAGLGIPAESLEPGTFTGTCGARDLAGNSTMWPDPITVTIEPPDSPPSS